MRMQDLCLLTVMTFNFTPTLTGSAIVFGSMYYILHMFSQRLFFAENQGTGSPLLTLFSNNTVVFPKSQKTV